MGETSDLELYRLLIEQWDALVAVVTGPDHVFAMANAAYRKMFGNGLVGHPVREALPKASARLFEALDRVYRDGQTFALAAVPVVCQGQNPTSVFIDFTYQAFKGPSGAIKGVTIQGIDVTNHIVLQDELRANAAMAAETLDVLPQSICLFDKFLFLRMVNAAALSMSGRAAETVANKHYRDIVGDEHYARRKPVLDHVLQGHEVSFEEDWTHPDGSRRVFNYTFIPRWIDGEVVGFYLVTRDATPGLARLLN